MASSQRLSHVAMSVPAGTLTDEWRARLLEFYGDVFGWHEIESLRRPDRLTIAVGSDYINIRDRADAPTYSGYEHFGVVVESKDEARRIWQAANVHPEATVEPYPDVTDGFLSYRLHYLLPLAVEVQYFPTSG